MSIADERHAEVHLQREALPRGLILRVLLVTIILAAVLCVVAYVFLQLRLVALRPSLRFPEARLPPPREVAGVRQEVFELGHPRPTLIEEQRARLEGYGWIDRPEGLVRIPIRRAMEVWAAREQRR